MKYSLTAKSTAHQSANIMVQNHKIPFGITATDHLSPNPAELLLGAFAACCLKSIERFSELLKFEYDSATIEVVGERQEKPTRISRINYRLSINSQDASLKPELLHKNIQRYGTIYNTLKASCEIIGELTIANDCV